MTAYEYREQIEMMSKSMFRYCLSRTGSYHDAEDLAQEIMLISCKGEQSFENEKVHIMRWTLSRFYAIIIMK
ncbi:sigma factor [Ruminococcus albus]|uniref:Sigma-70 region 2 n=1 Tax=Ruminococcus albus TaxID=1264 RepID=A0A1I1M852_RUMAL|nr:sigma factor [Ruminococcus albus]SFC77840.1 Sigma-70 region 2 [Ruminococcus albus]